MTNRVSPLCYSGSCLGDQIAYYVLRSCCQWEYMCAFSFFNASLVFFTYLCCLGLHHAELAPIGSVHRELGLRKYESESQSCLTLCNPMDYTVHGILQATILEWVAFPFSRESSQPRDWTQVSHIAGGFFTRWATREAQESMLSFNNNVYLKNTRVLQTFLPSNDKYPRC